MTTLTPKLRRMTPWLVTCVVAGLLTATVAQARTSIDSLDVKLDAIDAKVDMLLADSVSGGGVVPVSLVQRVNPDNQTEDRTGDTTVTLRVCIGTNPCTSSDAALADRIRQGSAEVLVVTSITAIQFTTGLPPADGYGIMNFGACRSGFFPRLFGIPVVTVDGRGTTHVTLRPGALVGGLIDTERLCFAFQSYGQSTAVSEVTLHGYLTAAP